MLCKSLRRRRFAVDCAHMRPSDAEVASMWKLAPMEDWDTVKVGCIGLLFCYVKKLSILMFAEIASKKEKSRLRSSHDSGARVR